MAEEKITPTQQSSDEEDQRKWAPPSRALQRRRITVICGVSAAAIILVGATLLVLTFTVYRIREPEMTIDSITAHRRDGKGSGGSLFASLYGNSTVEISAFVRNPNKVTYYYDNTLTSFYYAGAFLANSDGPSGRAAPGRTYRLNVTVDVSNFKLSDAMLSKALKEREVDVIAATMIDGHVKVFGLVRHNVNVLLNCTVNLAVANFTILGQTCWQHVWA